MRYKSYLHLLKDYLITVLLCFNSIHCNQILIQQTPTLQAALNQSSSNQQQAQSQTQPPPLVTLNNPSFISPSNNIKPLIQALAVSPNIAVPTSSQVDRAPTVNQMTQAHTSFRDPSSQLPQSILAEDSVTNLDYSSINDEILRKPTANFVYFNANFNNCRNCGKFFNIWKDLASDIRWWRQVIRLYTINCSDEDNVEVCRRAGATQFPQVKFYWVMSSSLDRDGQRLRILGKSVHAMRHMITDKVIESYVEHNKILADKMKQRNQNPLASLSLTNSSPFGGTNNMLFSMIAPLLNQFSGSNNQRPATSSAIGSITNMLSAPAINNKSSSGSSPLSGLISSFGGLSGLSQLLGGSSDRLLHQRFNAQQLPMNWPELEPIVTSNTQHLLDMLPLDTTKNVGALLIMETQEFLYTGIEVMLDLNPYSNQTYIARVSDERSQLSKNLTSRDDIVAPALIYVTSSRELRLIMTAPKYTNDEDLRRTFVRAFEKRQIKYPLKRVWSSSKYISGGLMATNLENQDDGDLLAKVNNVYMNDLINTVRASLMEQVFRHADLSDDQYNALVKYIYTLINYFPFNSDESLKFFKRLHAWLQNQVSPLDINEYKKQFHDIDDVFQKTNWIACRSLSNINVIPDKSSKSSALFESPAQIGKMVSNITRLLRDQQHSGQLKNLFSLFSPNSSPVMLNQKSKVTITTTTLKPSHQGANEETEARVTTEKSDKQNDSPLERIIKSLTSGSFGSDSSILKLISTALSGSSGLTGGKSKFAREYPCGAWKLAHVLVVNEYIKDSPRKDVKHIVLHTLYQYLLHFYACSTCGNRVTEVSSEFRLVLDDHLLDQHDSVMLLWKMHNRINKRLEGESRPGSPAKVQFPTESLCSKCRTQRASNDLVSIPDWQEKQVLTFLVHHYRPQNIMLISNSSDASTSSANHIVDLSLANYLLYLTTIFVLVWLALMNWISASVRLTI